MHDTHSLAPRPESPFIPGGVWLRCFFDRCFNSSLYLLQQEVARLLPRMLLAAVISVNQRNRWPHEILLRIANKAKFAHVAIMFPAPHHLSLPVYA